MKHLIIALAIIGMLLPIALAAVKADDITGIWFNDEKTSKIQIYRTTSGSYAGKIVWLKEPNDAKNQPRKDVENPDKKLQSRALMNLVILSGLEFNGKNQWKGGKIYDPKSGKTYSCKAELDGANTLKLRGYIGVSLIGRTAAWVRTK